MEEQRSLSIQSMMKGNTQFPQVPEGEVVEEEVVEGVVVVVVVVVLELVQLPDSSPRLAKENLFRVMTAALLERPATPVAVFVVG